MTLSEITFVKNLEKGRRRNFFVPLLEYDILNKLTSFPSCGTEQTFIEKSNTRASLCLCRSVT
jgi:hypothetical protein